MVDFKKVDKAMLERICANAKLSLTSSEEERFISEMEEILSAFRELESVDTKGVQPAYHATEIRNVWREDKVKKKNVDIKKNTGAIEDGYIIGPKLV
ncbi:MAG: Asp-tRNA(Asn)/Glu-tRNA(Gln) amidotransferase subunit GatC [Candidatus Micrarchaeia archaeon]